MFRFFPRVLLANEMLAVTIVMDSCYCLWYVVVEASNNLVGLFQIRINMHVNKTWKKVPKLLYFSLCKTAKDCKQRS